MLYIGDLANIRSDEPHTESSEDLYEDLYGAHLSTSFIPNATQLSKRQYSSQFKICRVVDLPTLLFGPRSEELQFTTEGYFSMAFPPTGASLDNASDHRKLFHPPISPTYSSMMTVALLGTLGSGFLLLTQVACR